MGPRRRRQMAGDGSGMGRRYFGDPTPLDTYLGHSGGQTPTHKAGQAASCPEALAAPMRNGTIVSLLPAQNPVPPFTKTRHLLGD